MSTEQILKELENMPSGCSHRLKIGENERGLAFVQIENPGATMEALKMYNAESEGYSLGYAAAVKKHIEWINELYLKIKGLK